MTDRLQLRHVDVSYDVVGDVDRIKLKFLDAVDLNVAYTVSIEPNDHRRFPTEIAVVRRRFVGPTIRDCAEDVLSDRDRAYETEAEAWQEIDRLLTAATSVAA